MDDQAIVLGMEFFTKVEPWMVDNGVLTITSKGMRYMLSLAVSKDVGKSRIAALQAKWTCTMFDIVQVFNTQTWCR